MECYKVGDTNVRVTVPLIPYFMEFVFQTHLAGLGCRSEIQKQFYLLGHLCQIRKFAYLQKTGKKAYFFEQ